MPKSAPTRLLLSALTILLWDCTAVLGIQRAELDDAGFGGSGASGAAGSRPDSKCVTAPGCSACLMSSCTSAAVDCLADSECRRSLDDYTRCLGSDCTDEGSLCAESKLAGPVARPLAGCMLLDHCLTECRSGALVAKCELYCACMQGYCPSEFTAKLGNAKEKCVAACGLLSERDVSCRWNHCEFALLGATLHCPHAIGEIDVCNAVVSPKVCLAGQESGFPCERDSQCCSMSCFGMVCK